MPEMLTFFEVGDRFGTILDGEARVWFVNDAGLPELVVPIEYGCGTTAAEEAHQMMVPYRNKDGVWAIDMPPRDAATTLAAGGTIIFSPGISRETVLNAASHMVEQAMKDGE